MIYNIYNITCCHHIPQILSKIICIYYLISLIYLDFIMFLLNMIDIPNAEESGWFPSNTEACQQQGISTTDRTNQMFNSVELPVPLWKWTFIFMTSYGGWVNSKQGVSTWCCPFLRSSISIMIKNHAVDLLRVTVIYITACISNLYCRNICGLLTSR